MATDGNPYVDDCFPIPKGWDKWLTKSNWQDIDRLRSALSELGLTGRKLALQDSQEDRTELLKQLTEFCCIGPDLFFGPLLDSWIDHAIKTQPFKIRLSGGLARPELQNIWDSVHSCTAGTSTSSITTATPWTPIIPKASTARPKTFAEASPELELERTLKEQASLREWSRKLFNIFELSGTPIALQVDHCLNPGKAMLEIAGGTRPKTLKVYVTHWYRFEGFLERTKSKCWPDHPSDYVDYLHFLGEEPCAPTVPDSFIMAARFIEKKSGFEADRCFVDSPLVKAVKERLSERLKGPGGPTKRAPRFPSVIIEKLESLVTDPQVLPYLRGVAWLRLVKVWAGMRFSCHNYLSPGRLNLFDGELYGTLKKTKTTGPTRRIKELPLHVCSQAYIKERSWLKVGFELWQTLAPFERDYFLPKPTNDRKSTVRRMAEYSDSAAAGYEILNLLTTADGTTKLLDPQFSSFFTEHSERATLATALSVLGCSKEDRDLVGRWKPDGSDTYVRTYHALIAKLQTTAASAMRKQDRFEVLQEKEIPKQFSDWLRDRHQFTVEEANSMAEDLKRSLQEPPCGITDVEELSQPSSPINVEEDSEDKSSVALLSDSSIDLEPTAWSKCSSRPSNQYIIVYDKKKKGRLHRTDGCWMARYRALKNPKLIEKEPNTDSYSFRCRLCWPTGLPVEDHSSAGSEESEGAEVEMPSEPEGVANDFHSMVPPQMGHTATMSSLASEWDMALQGPSELIFPFTERPLLQSNLFRNLTEFGSIYSIHFQN